MVQVFGLLVSFCALFSFPNQLCLLGVKGKERQTVGEIYDLFESVGVGSILVKAGSFTEKWMITASRRSMAQERL